MFKKIYKVDFIKQKRFPFFVIASFSWHCQPNFSAFFEYRLSTIGNRCIIIISGNNIKSVNNSEFRIFKSNQRHPWKKNVMVFFFENLWGGLCAEAATGGVLWKICSSKFRITGKHLCQSLLFNEVAVLRPAKSFRRRLWHRCFPVNFAKKSLLKRIPFFQNTSRGMLLHAQY